MKTIDIKCATCGSIYSLNDNGETPRNVSYISTSYCHNCEGEGERTEHYVYKQKKEKTTFVDNEAQESLF